MKGTSKVIMAATLVLVVTLAMVLGLVLVLLAELYCSLLLRRRRQRHLPTSTTVATIAASSGPANPPASQSQETRGESVSSPLSSFYAQGVLQAPRSFFFPSAPSTKEANVETKTRVSKLHQESISEPASSPVSPELICEIRGQPIISPISNDKTVSSCIGGEHFIYISNPIYEGTSKPDTPFETPDSSPSRLEAGSTGGSSSSGEDEETGGAAGSPITTPPLTPMKKLPEKACSISLRDATSLATSDSDSKSNGAVSSSSSGSPCTSPSW